MSGIPIILYLFGRINFLKPLSTRQGANRGGCSPAGALATCGGSKKGPDGRSGFTLMEMAVVVFILSVVASLVLPRLPFAHERDLKASARNLAASLRYLEDLAVSKKQHYRFRCALMTNEIEVVRVIPEGDEFPVSDNTLSGLSLREGIVFADVVTSRLGKITEKKAVLDFGPLGIEELAVFHLKRKTDTRFYTVVVYPGGSRVTVLEGYQEGTLAEDDEEEDDT